MRPDLPFFQSVTTATPTTPQDRYSDYLQTDYWKAVSDAVKKKADYRCQVCNSPHDLQAHHRSYAHRGHELDHLDDVTCLCRRCHGIFHGTFQAPQQAPARVQVEAPPEMVLITPDNCKRIRPTKECWHWMLDTGINPKKSGWALRAIGTMMPKKFLR